MKVLTFLLIFLAFTLAVRGQDAEPIRFTFHHISISVTDLDRSVKFYTSVLNLNEITDKGSTQGVRWFSLGDDKELHLISIVKEPVTTNKAIHLALTTPNFDAFVKKLDKLKIEYSDWPGNKGKINLRADGVKQVFLQDPDGYWIEVNSAAKI
jgi:catechol 2,3-dioxygenase-like lactoylglutathione lyase family enzyme